MIDALWEIADLARAIVGLLAVDILLNGVRLWRCAQSPPTQSPNALTESAPTPEPEKEAQEKQEEWGKLKKRAKELEEAWSELQNYGVNDAYGGEAP